MTESTAIRLEGVDRTYTRGPVTEYALRDVTLTVPAGQFVVLLGPSGSGKTTLLNVIGGIEEPSVGTVIVDGCDLSGLAGRELSGFRATRIGFVFQFFDLIPTLTACENVEVIAELGGPHGARRAAQALTDVGLGDRLDRFPAELSGGEQQRVAVARALVKDAAVVLADEPTGSLDLENGRQVLALLQRAGRAGTTVVVVTHNSAIAAIADRVIHLRDGSIATDRRQDTPVAAREVTW